MSEHSEGSQSGRRFPVVVAIVGVLVVGVVLGAAGVKLVHSLRSPSTSTPPASVAQASAGYGLDAPTSATLFGPDLFVANQAGNSVSVVNSSTGAHLATLSGSSFAFDAPVATAAAGPDLFVANGSGNSVTEVDPRSRSVVRVVSGSGYQLHDPMALAAEASELFVLSSDGTVTAMSAANGALIGVVPGGQLGLASPSGIAVADGHLYVTDATGNSVTVLDERTLSPVTTWSGAAYGFSSPAGAVAHGGALWVTNNTADSVSQVELSTGRPVRVIVDHTNLPTPGPIAAGDGYVFTLSPPGTSPMVSQIDPAQGKVAWMMCNTNGPYLFSNPQALAVAGSNLWVVNKDGNSLTEMNSDSGALIRTIS